MHLNLSSATRWGLNGLILVGLSLALHLGRSIFIPTVIAVLLAAMLWPAVVWLNRPGVPLPGLARAPRFPWLAPCAWRLRLPWPAACAVGVAVLVVLAVGVTFAFGVAIPKMLQALPNDPRKAEEFYSRVRDHLQRLSPVPL